MAKISPVASTLTQLRADKVLNWALGNYKGYKKASKEFAKFAVANKEAISEMPPMQKISVPLFSKTGLNMAKIWFLEKFRIKTPEEKELRQYAKAEEMRKKLFRNG